MFRHLPAPLSDLGDEARSGALKGVTLRLLALFSLLA
jgi:hypothetical protein